MREKVRDHKVQTTVRLPKALYEQARACVEKGFTSAESLNDFFIFAIQSYTRALRRKRIDAAFDAMAGDADYHREAESVTDDFAESDWDSLGEGLSGEDETHAAR
jgi:hypothetical protein